MAKVYFNKTCHDCGHNWYPDEKDPATECPVCGSTNLVSYVEAKKGGGSSFHAQRDNPYATAQLLLGVVVALAIGFFWYTENLAPEKNPFREQFDVHLYGKLPRGHIDAGGIDKGSGASGSGASGSGASGSGASGSGASGSGASGSGASGSGASGSGASGSGASGSGASGSGASGSGASGAGTSGSGASSAGASGAGASGSGGTSGGAGGASKSAGGSTTDDIPLPPVGADELHLTDGRKLLGKVVAEADEVVSFKHRDVSGKVVTKIYKRAQIARVVRKP